MSPALQVHHGLVIRLGHDGRRRGVLDGEGVLEDVRKRHGPRRGVEHLGGYARLNLIVLRVTHLKIKN